MATVMSFAERVQYFVLRHQFTILLENYEDAFAAVVKFVNENCNVTVEPDTSNFEDIPQPILKILNSQMKKQVASPFVTAYTQ